METFSPPRRPIAWVGGYPLDATTLLVALHSLAMIGCALLMAFGGDAWLRLLEMSTAEAGQGQAWRWITYGFVEAPSLWFVLRMIILYAFGREVERALGARAMAALYGALLLGPALAMQVAGSALSLDLRLAGPEFCILGIFTAFATLHPQADVLIARLTARVMVWIFLVLYTLEFLAIRQPLPGLVVAWTAAAVGVLGVRMMHGATSPGWWRYWSGWLQERRIERQARRRTLQMRAPALMSIDAVLEKISRKGMASLTHAERQQLEEARSELLNQQRRN